MVVDLNDREGTTETGAELERDPTDLINGMNRGGEPSQVRSPIRIREIGKCHWPIDRGWSSYRSGAEQQRWGFGGWKAESDCGSPELAMFNNLAKHAQ